MKIRALTYFYDPNLIEHANAMQQAAEHAGSLRHVIQTVGYEIETVRIATTPFPTWLSLDKPGEVVEAVQRLERLAEQHGNAYLSLGPALPEHGLAFSLIPRILNATSKVFATGMMTRAGSVVDLQAVRSCATVIHETAPQSPDGFNNLRFSALANVPPGCPYFPSAYAQSGKNMSFALAIESADVAYQVFKVAASFDTARSELLRRLEEFTRLIETEISRLPSSPKLEFGGFDISLAPHPSPGNSLGEAIEALGIPAYGLAGSLAASAFVTSTLDMGTWRMAGFNGLMVPVLEDSGLAKRAAEGTLTVKDLVMFSAVCGTGLDTLPLPGDCTIEQLNAILLDIASLAQRLDKALTARLMPIPGKKPGDPTEFEFEYFANSRVMGISADPLMGLFTTNSQMVLTPRRTMAR